MEKTLSEFGGEKGLVLDTSAVINLNGTERTAEIFSAIPNPCVIMSAVEGELRGGQTKGYGDWDRLQLIRRAGLISLVDLSAKEYRIFRRLVDGPRSETLGDGEAATIARACTNNEIAILDDRKAVRIAMTRYDMHRVLPTVVLLLDPRVKQEFGLAGQSDAVYAALRNARMQVPEPYFRSVLMLIGEERAAECPSLRRSLRSL